MSVIKFPNRGKAWRDLRRALAEGRLEVMTPSEQWIAERKESRRRAWPVYPYIIGWDLAEEEATR